MNNWFEINNTDSILSPSLLFYPERIKSNIDQMIQIAGSAVRLRPHIKTYKCREIVALQMKAGITKFKCATLSEAQMLAEQGVKDVLLSYPLVGPGQMKFLEIFEKYPNTKFSTLVDHPQQIESWGTKTNKPISLFIDLDVGMHRTGILPENALELFQLIQNAGFHFAGLHVYDGHIHDHSISERKKTVDNAFAKVSPLIQKINNQVGHNFEVVCGGSISFPIHAQYTDRILSPGTTLLWDQGYFTNFPDLDFQPAAVLLTRVVSKPGENKLCLDLGHKAVASEMKVSPVYFPQLPDAKIAVHSEEHLVLETKTSNQFEIGDVLYGIPWHICPTVALHEQALIIEEKKMIGSWNIESRKRNYLL